MKVLLTGANGYVGRRLLPILLSKGHQVYCCVRDKARFDVSAYPQASLKVLEVDFLDPASLKSIPEEIDAAYYLIHSMSSSTSDFTELEKNTARNFINRMRHTRLRQLIYLGGIANEEKLSRHLRSRKAVEEILREGDYALTTLRAGIIVGSGSASFEIIRDLVEKLPVMVAPRWLLTHSQPIAVRNVLEFLEGVLMREDTFNQVYDIGGPEVLTYKEMLLQFALVRGLKRRIYIVPVMTPKLSSYWLYFITSTSYKLAVNLVHSMKVEVVGRPNDLAARLGIRPIPYPEAVSRALSQTANDTVPSSWINARSGDLLQAGIHHLSSVPEFGCFSDKRSREVADPELSWQRVIQIGGKNGWYYANALWGFRGFLDKLVGGVGLRRGRRNQHSLQAGEALDFWRVVEVDPEKKHLLLYAEMKLPGEAWLEFKISGNSLVQTATFRPLGLWGRMYWYSVLPFHAIIFNGLIDKLGRA
jgi:uncharacterized protein YbjT (DUF2867 family)